MGQTFYIDQFPTPSFPIGLVKTESGLVRSVETGLGRQTLVVAVISVHAYPFLKVGTKRLLHQQIKISG